MTAPRATPAQVEERVAIVLDLMSSGRWLSRASSKKLAAEWGVSRRTVQDYSRMASKLLWNDTPEDVLEQRVNTLCKLEMLAAKADAKGDLRTSVMALATHAKIAGSEASQRLTLGTEPGAPLVIHASSGPTPAELWVQAAAAGRVTVAEAQAALAGWYQDPTTPVPALPAPGGAAEPEQDEEVDHG